MEKKLLYDFAGSPKAHNPERCPTCGEQYNHLMAVKVLMGSDDEGLSTKVVSMTGENLNVREEHGLVKHWARMRGLGVVMYFDCEYGHSWRKQTFFHKGCTYSEDIAMGKSVYFSGDLAGEDISPDLL